MTSFLSSHKGHSPFPSCSALQSFLANQMPIIADVILHLVTVTPVSQATRHCWASVGPTCPQLHALRWSFAVPRGASTSRKTIPHLHGKGVSDTCLPCVGQRHGPLTFHKTLKEVLIYPVPLKIEL